MFGVHYVIPLKFSKDCFNICGYVPYGLVYLTTWMVDLYGKCQCRRIYNTWLLRVFSKVSLVSEIVLLWKLTCSLKHDGWKTRSLFRVHVILHHWQLLLNPWRNKLDSCHLILSHSIYLRTQNAKKTHKHRQTRQLISSDFIISS